MPGACPAPDPDTPLVRGLLTVTDCNVRGLVHSAYGSIFAPQGALAGGLTALLTLYVAFVGYRLMTGRGQVRVTDFALNLVKIGAVIALATQWETYQALVYDFLFTGPQQVATAILSSSQIAQPAGGGDVFDGLQAAFDSLNLFGSGYASHVPGSTSPLLGGTGFAAFLLTSSATGLLFASLGTLLASKIVLGLLLGVGPIFIALLLFESTRGLFEGWLRASLAFALAPLAVTVLLGVILTMLAPSLVQMQELQQQQVYVIGPAFSVATLTVVFGAVTLGALIAGGVIATGFRLPGARSVAEGAARQAATPPVVAAAPADQPRAARIAAAAAALDRRETINATSDSRVSDRRTSILAGAAALAPDRAGADTPRLGQQASRRRAEPRTRRTEAASPLGGLSFNGKKGA